MKKSEPQTEQLRHAIRDLVALSMPATWIDCDPQHLADLVVELLISALRLDVGGIRLETVDSETRVEAWRGDLSPGFLEWYRRLDALRELRQPAKCEMLWTSNGRANANARLRIVVTPLGVQGDCGRIVVGSSRRDFPNNLDRLLLSIAANQAVTAFRLLSEAGARGYVLKSDLAGQLVKAVKVVSTGRVYMTPKVSEIVLGEFVNTGIDSRRRESSGARLTPPETEIIRLLAQGKVNKVIASKLGITTRAVETHRAKIMLKLGLHSLTQLIHYAIRHNIVSPQTF